MKKNACCCADQMSVFFVYLVQTIVCVCFTVHLNRKYVDKNKANDKKNMNGNSNNKKRWPDGNFPACCLLTSNMGHIVISNTGNGSKLNYNRYLLCCVKLTIHCNEHKKIKTCHQKHPYKNASHNMNKTHRQHLQSSLNGHINRFFLSFLAKTNEKYGNLCEI